MGRKETDPIPAVSPLIGRESVNNLVGLGLSSCGCGWAHPLVDATPRPAGSEGKAAAPLASRVKSPGVFSATNELCTLLSETAKDRPGARLLLAWLGVVPACNGLTSSGGHTQQRQQRPTRHHSPVTTRQQAVVGGQWSALSALCCAESRLAPGFPQPPAARSFSLPDVLLLPPLPSSPLARRIGRAALFFPPIPENLTRRESTLSIPGTTDPDARCAVLACSGVAVGCCVFTFLRNIRSPNFFPPLSHTHPVRPPTPRPSSILTYPPSSGSMSSRQTHFCLVAKLRPHNLSTLG